MLLTLLKQEPASATIRSARLPSGADGTDPEWLLAIPATTASEWPASWQQPAAYCAVHFAPARQLGIK